MDGNVQWQGRNTVSNLTNSVFGTAIVNSTVSKASGAQADVESAEGSLATLEAEKNKTEADIAQLHESLGSFMQAEMSWYYVTAT